MNSKKPGRPKGPKKKMVRFYATEDVAVGMGDALRLARESLTYGEFEKKLRESLGHAAPVDVRIKEVISRPLPVPVEAFKSPFPAVDRTVNFLKPMPGSTPKPQNPVKGKERPPLELPDGVRQNYFKK